jgi:hypothetical protein
MNDYWIVTGHAFVEHPNPAIAEAERERLAAKEPRKAFAVRRCVRDGDGAVFNNHDFMREVRGVLINADVIVSAVAADAARISEDGAPELQKIARDLSALLSKLGDA